MKTLISQPLHGTKICRNCILPGSFPGITFNDDGVCNFCQKHNGKQDRLPEEKKKYKQKFLELLNQLVTKPRIRGIKRAYDVLVSYSGGKDSTYTLWLLKTRYRLRVLALTVDNSFLSETAARNIRNVTDELAIDHLFVKPGWRNLRKIFAAAAERELYAKKALERASTICTSCMGIVKSLCLKTAIEMDIPMIGYGWSPGQAPLESALMKNNPSFIRTTQQAVMKPLREIVGGDIDAYFLNETHLAGAEKMPYNVHPLAWEQYSETMIIDEIRKIGWVAPQDTDSNSTNCLLNAYANDVHIRRYGFHPYVWEIANMVREGIMPRDEGYKKIYEEQNAEFVLSARERLFRQTPLSSDRDGEQAKQPPSREQ
jgi:predicted PP-loop superfamily ATPase